MKQKILFLIALVLALSQGAAASEVIDLLAENFSAYVGQQETRSITLTYVAQGAIRFNNDGRQEPSTLKDGNNFTVSIEGQNSRMFAGTLTKVDVTAGNTTTTYTATVNVTYNPTAGGDHTATLHLLNTAGVSVASQKLAGHATYLKGDADGDGLVTIADISTIIDYLLYGNEIDIIMEAADVDGDGTVSIADTSALIDIILGVPDMRLCTFLFVTKTDGTSTQYQIDEYTKINIVKPNLVIKYRPNGYMRLRTVTYPLDELAQLRYEERMVTYDKSTLMLMLNNVAQGEDMIETDSSTPKTEQP